MLYITHLLFFKTKFVPYKTFFNLFNANVREMFFCDFLEKGINKTCTVQFNFYAKNFFILAGFVIVD